MEMTGEQLVPAPLAETWAALNDSEILKACIPGCETMEKVSDAEYAVQMTARVGPVSAKFKGKLLLSDIQPPNSYALAFEGQGGVAGFAKGTAQVRLAAKDAGSTTLSYTAKANVGGKLAQIGSRLIDAAAQKVAGEFFTTFNQLVAAARGAAAAQDAPQHQGEHHAVPLPRDPDLPDIAGSTLAFFAAGALVVFIVALVTLF